MHIGMIRLSSMGDLIIQTPWISRIKLFNPNIKITVVTFENFKGILDGHPHIDNIHYLPRLKGMDDIKQLMSLSKKLDRDCDIVFDLHGTLRAKLMKFFMWRTPLVRVYKRTFLRWLLVKFKIDWLKKLEGQQFRTINDFSFLFNCDANIDQLTQFLQEKCSNSSLGVTSVAQSFSKKDIQKEKYLVFSPVASFETKRWPMGKVLNLLKLVLKEPHLNDYRIYILAGAADSYIDELMIPEIIDTNRVVNLQGETSLSQTLDIIKNATLCFTNDTGSLHMAEALGVKSLCIFGATSESFGFRPHLKKSISLSAANVKCRPCSATGSKKCVMASYLCMDGVSETEVLVMIRKMLEDDL